MPRTRQAPTLTTRVAGLEERTGRLEELTERLAVDSAKTAASVEDLRDQIAASEDRVTKAVTAAVTSSEERLERRLDHQDAATDGIKDAAEAARRAADDANRISKDALAAAEKRWPRAAKAVVSLLTGVAVGLIVWAITVALG